ncbi:MAG: hypothetical protein ACRDTN_12650, partial [Mycobacterium sp.]
TDVIGGDPVYGSPAGQPITYDYGLTPWYTADVTSSGTDIHTVVTKVLDPSVGYPSVGTVADQYTFSIPEDDGGYPTLVPLFAHYSVSDPNLGTGSMTEFFPFVANFYVSDKAGIEDQVSFAGARR